MAFGEKIKENKKSIFGEKAEKPKNTNSEKEGKYIIVGKKYFDSNGNTYHVVRIIDADSNKEIYESPVTYGYGDQWRQTAYDELKKQGKAKEDDRFNHEMNRKRFIYIDSGYVTRKKDL